MRYADKTYWDKKEQAQEIARLEKILGYKLPDNKEPEYEMTQEDIDDIKYNEYANK